MTVSQREQHSYLQSITDSLCGYKLQDCAVGQAPLETPSSIAEADRLRSVWRLLDVLNPPEPDAALLERIYRQVVTLAASDEIDDDELDWAVGAAKSPDTDPDPDDSEKDR